MPLSQEIAGKGNGCKKFVSVCHFFLSEPIRTKEVIVSDLVSDFMSHLVLLSQR